LRPGILKEKMPRISFIIKGTLDNHDGYVPESSKRSFIWLIHRVNEAHIGDDVRVELLDEKWLASVKEQCQKVGARMNIQGDHTHRLVVPIDPTASSPLDITEDELQPLLRAISLSHIVKPTNVAMDDIKIKSIYEDNGSVNHLCMIGNANMSIAFTSPDRIATTFRSLMVAGLFRALSRRTTSICLPTQRRIVTTRASKNAWNTACRKAGITNLRFHDLRHTFGTRAVDNGASIAAVQKVMGHKSIETTMQYVHATDEGKRRAVEAVVKTQKPVASGFPVTIRSQNEKRHSA